MYKLAIFDMDGTILNTLAGLASSCNYALGKAGFPAHTAEEYKRFVGNGVKKLVERALPPEARTEKTVAEVLEIFNGYYSEHSMEDTEHYGELPEVLRELRGAGVKLAVASNKPPVFGRMYADHFFGEGFFECVMGPTDSIPPKPDPRMLLAAIKACGALPEESCYFGDSDVDIMTGVNACVATAGVLWGFRPESELLKAGASRILHEYREILDFAGVRS